MKFKILPGCELFDKLQDINNGVIAARAAIRDTLKARGFSGKFGTDRNHLISCDAVEILGDKPDGWRFVGASWQKMYLPKATNKSMLKELSALPSISNDVLNNLLNFSFCTGPNLEVYFRPGVAWHKEYVLVDTDKAPYEPIEGMVEILESEYNKLYTAIKD